MIQTNVSDTPICIDVSQIPEETRYYIGAATYDFITRLLEQPGMKEKIQDRISKKNIQKKGEKQDASNKHDHNKRSQKVCD